MNTVCLIGRLTRDPETRTTMDGTAVCKFSIAVDRVSEGTDFPNIVCFGKTAENVARYMGKGRLVGISGRLQTGSYTKDDGTKVYTTDVIANNVQFLDKASEQNQGMNQGFQQQPQQFNQQPQQFAQQQGFQQQPMNQQQGFNQPQNQSFGFDEIDSDIPF